MDTNARAELRGRRLGGRFHVSTVLKPVSPGLRTDVAVSDRRSTRPTYRPSSARGASRSSTQSTTECRRCIHIASRRSSGPHASTRRSFSAMTYACSTGPLARRSTRLTRLSRHGILRLSLVVGRPLKSSITDGFVPTGADPAGRSRSDGRSRSRARSGGSIRLKREKGLGDAVSIETCATTARRDLSGLLHDVPRRRSAV